MKRHSLLAVAAAVALSAFNAAPLSPVHLQWSEATRSTSPDGRWVLAVEPVLTAEENASPVFIETRHGERANVTVLTRRADAFWTPDGNLIIASEPGEGDLEVHAYRIESTSGAPTVREKDLTEQILSQIRGVFPSGEINNVYLEKLESSSHIISVTVRGTYNVGDGPSTGYRLKLSYNDETFVFEEPKVVTEN